RRGGCEAPRGRPCGRPPRAGGARRGGAGGAPHGGDRGSAPPMRRPSRGAGRSPSGDAACAAASTAPSAVEQVELLRLGELRPQLLVVRRRARGEPRVAASPPYG